MRGFSYAVGTARQETGLILCVTAVICTSDTGAPWLLPAQEAGQLAALVSLSCVWLVWKDGLLGLALPYTTPLPKAVVHWQRSCFLLAFPLSSLATAQENKVKNGVICAVFCRKLGDTFPDGADCVGFSSGCI